MKIISFSQQGPRAICILSANGVISSVTLRQPDSSGGTLTYEVSILSLFNLMSIDNFVQFDDTVEVFQIMCCFNSCMFGFLFALLKFVFNRCILRTLLCYWKHLFFLTCLTFIQIVLVGCRLFPECYAKNFKVS